MFYDDELPILNLKSVKEMDGMAKTRLMEDLHEEYQNSLNSHHMRLFYSDLLSILVKNHGH
jgi:hypothetical protein|tara:strand:+ start:4639 stop:4821 length:183 start_codon:yes stop_codon:yes gene_type:complete